MTESEVLEILRRTGVFREGHFRLTSGKHSDLCGAMTLRRGFAFRAGERVLVVEDVLTTGGSVREVMDVVRQHGAVPVAVGALVDRSGGRVQFEVPHRVLVSLTSNIYDPEDCPLCRRGLPVVKPGSRPVEG